MNRHGKKYQKAQEVLKTLKVNLPVSSQEGIAKIKELAYARFDETVSADVNLSIDPQRGEQTVRGSVMLPHGTGKKVKVLVFAKGEYADEAEKAGADYVGVEDLIEKIEGGWTDFNYAVATPDLMGIVGKVAKILGPLGLLPNKKSGTVTFDIAPVVHDLKEGLLFFRNDKSGIVHFAFGRVSFSREKLEDNFHAFIKALAAARPPTAKGEFIKKVTISSTMGVGISVSVDRLRSA